MRLLIKLLLLTVFTSALTLSLHSQKVLPKIVPIRIEALVSENDPTQYAYRNMVIDSKGRLWLKTTGVAEQSYAMQVLQFDGYNRWIVDVAKDEWKDLRGGYLESFTDNGYLYGYLNDPLQQSTLYTFNAATNRIHYTPMSEGIVGAIEAYETGRFWVLEKTKNAFKLHQWDGTNLAFFASIPNTSHYEMGHGFLRYSDTDFIYQDSTLWIFDDLLPIINYNQRDQSIKRYTKADFMKGRSLSNKKNSNYNHDLEIRGYQVFVVHNSIGDQFYMLDKGADDQVFMPLGLAPEHTRAHSIWKDEQNNLLFLVEHLDTPKKKMGAYLLDASNQFFDYSSMIDGVPPIRSILSQDFKQQLYIGTASGAYFVQASSPNGITAYPEMKGGLRYIRQVDSDEFLVRSQRNWLQLIKNGSVFNVPDDNCLADEDSFEGGITLLTDPKGEVWLKSRYTLARYAPAQDGSCIRYTFDHAISKAIFLTAHKLVLVEERTRQLSIYDLQDEKRTKLKAFSDQSKGVLHYIITSSKNVLWLATNEGLFKVNLDTDETQHFGGTPDFEDNRILAIHDNQKGQLWLGTVNSGIQIFDKAQGEVVKVIDESDGLSNNIVVGILEDEQGYIWAATYNGLNLIKSTGEIVTIFKKEDGLTDNEFNRYAHFKAANGRLLFGTVDGLNMIDPIKAKETLRSSGVTKIYVSRLSFFDTDLDRIVHQRNYELGEQMLKLPADKRFISINVGASNYGQNTKNRYAYRFKGLDQEWTYMGTEHFIRLPNLPSGKYTLEIVGVDHNGNKTANTINIPIHAQEFFYKQAWFYILMAIPFLVFGLLWVFRLRKEKEILEKEVKKRTTQIRKDKELIEQQASELQQLDNMKSRFFANISHDFRTPLTLITGPAEVMKNDDDLPKKTSIRQSLQSILQNGKKLLNLVDEMLDLAKLESNEVKLHEEIVDLFHFCKSIYSSFQVAAERQQIIYEFNYHLDHDYLIVTDPRRLERILNNLLSNAFKFTEDEEEISLEVSLKDDTIYFEIRDTGRGIPLEDLPFVFDRFFQSKQVSLTLNTGSGIGLSLSQELANLLGGSIQVVSTQGKGSTFTLLLPASRAEQSEKATAISDLHIPDTAAHVKDVTNTNDEEQFRILVVEDNLEVQSFLSSLLSNNYQVATAKDGQEALTYLQQKDKAIDLILSDVNMPVMNGYELLSALKEDKKLRQLPVIMLTAKTKERSKFKALRMGVDDYLTKPFSPTELLLRIQNLLDNYQKRLDFQKEFLAVNPEFEPNISADQKWLKELEKHALHALSQRLDLNANYLAANMALSERQLARKVRLLTGLTVGKYMQEIKLQKARNLIEQNALPTIAEVGYACGFKSPSYFTKLFTEHFGKSPTMY